jgi:hypothetical protein
MHLDNIQEIIPERSHQTKLSDMLEQKKDIQKYEYLQTEQMLKNNSYFVKQRVTDKKKHHLESIIKQSSTALSKDSIRFGYS